MKTLKVSEYAKQTGVAPITVYRKIEKGELQAITEDGIKMIIVPDDFQGNTEVQQSETVELQAEYMDNLNQIDELKEQNHELHKLVQQMQQDSESDKERSDTIILQLTQQLDNQTKLLEDMRNQPKTGFWARLLKRKGKETQLMIPLRMAMMGNLWATWNGLMASLARLWSLMAMTTSFAEGMRV